jgi:hypothetical protein
MRYQIVWLGDQGCPELVFVKGPEPVVVIAGHDRKLAPLATQSNHFPQTFTAQELDRRVSGCHREITEISDDPEPIIAT